MREAPWDGKAGAAAATPVASNVASTNVSGSVAVIQATELHSGLGGLGKLPQFPSGP
jgi:hypothetical protein